MVLKSGVNSPGSHNNALHSNPQSPLKQARCCCIRQVHIICFLLLGDRTAIPTTFMINEANNVPSPFFWNMPGGNTTPVEKSGTKRGWFEEFVLVFASLAPEYKGGTGLLWKIGSVCSLFFIKIEERPGITWHSVRAAWTYEHPLPGTPDPSAYVKITLQLDLDTGTQHSN